MRLIFADTFYWLALSNPRDAWHRKVTTFNRTLGRVNLVTTDEVLVEFLNFFSSFDAYMKGGMAQKVRDIIENTRVRSIPQTRESFFSGLELYENRLDKGYSLTDCVSMNTMQQLGILEVLTNDKHFTQEGFIILLGEDNSSR